MQANELTIDTTDTQLTDDELRLWQERQTEQDTADNAQA